MGRGFEFHQGHWSYQEGHPTTIAPVLQRQIIPKTRREKSPIQGMGMGMETLNRHEFLYTDQQTNAVRVDSVSHIYSLDVSGNDLFPRGVVTLLGVVGLIVTS